MNDRTARQIIRAPKLSRGSLMRILRIKCWEDESRSAVLGPDPDEIERLRQALQSIAVRTYSDDRRRALDADAVAEICDIAASALGLPGDESDSRLTTKKSRELGRS
jgi:hypothetical protein